jgi:protein involved in polysaccharide export with SLBB domain
MRTGNIAHRCAVLYFALLVVVLHPPLYGQLLKKDKDEEKDKGKASRPTVVTPDLTDLMKPEVDALESTINPETYFVGPSDVLALNIWSSPPVILSVTVTPEGTVLIPLVGEVDVENLSLAEAKRVIVEKIRTMYRGTAEPSVTLVKPRKVLVTVRGFVLNAGSFTVSAGNRVDKVIDRANSVSPTQTQEQLNQILLGGSVRNISVKHRDGTVSHVDILKFQATGEDQWNPYLREGDLIIVPRHDYRRNVVGIYGEVKLPTRYEFVEGDSIKDLLGIAQGFTPLAMTDSVEFSRLEKNGERMSSTFIDGLAILEGRAPDIALRPGDRIVVRARPDARGDYRVFVNGELRFPGVYPITKSSTKLSQVIAMAGGFTGTASIANAKLIRSSIRPEDVEMEQLESGRAGVTKEDSAYYSLETSLRIRKELVNVDFAGIFIAGDSTQDVYLREGDIIDVPAREHTVYVFGQVSTPGHVPYRPGENVGYYLDEAGGMTERARTGDVKVVKAKTKQWLSPDETSVEEGDYVWVPKEPEYSFAYYMAIIGQTAAILGVAISAVLVAREFSK